MRNKAASITLLVGILSILLLATVRAESVTIVNDDFSRDSGMWTYVDEVVNCDSGQKYPGSAYRDSTSEYLVLTQNRNYQCGIVWLNQDIFSPVTAEFRYKAGGGTGADGLVFMFYKKQDYTPMDGGCLSFVPSWRPMSPVSGYGVEFDNFDNQAHGNFPDPSGNHVALIKDTVDNHLMYSDDLRTEDNQWHHVKIIVGDSTVEVYVDGESVFTWEGTIDRAYGGIGIGASTAGGTNWHLIDDVRIYSNGGEEPPEPPPIQEMIKPVEGYMTSSFGWRTRNGQREFHNGIDISRPGILGAEIIAPVDGTVAGIGYSDVAGHWLKIEHESVERVDGSTVQGVSTGYCHLFEPPELEAGEPVKRGDVIGRVGSTGDSTGPHLHFVVREFGEAVDPLGYVDYSPKPGKGLKAEVRSPLDISIMDPDGYRVSKNLIEIEETATYLEEDFDGDGDIDDRIWITDRKLGNYTITVVPQPNALPGDTYSLEVTADEQTIILAENVLISNIPDEPYIIISTEDGIIPIIPAKVDFDPDTLNLRAEGKWITVYIELPVGHGYELSDINIDRTFLEGLLEVHHSDIQDGVLMVKFDMQDLIIYLQSVVGVIPPDDIPLTVTGELKDGRRFEGSDTIRVINTGGEN